MFTAATWNFSIYDYIGGMTVIKQEMKLLPPPVPSKVLSEFP